LRLYSLFKKLNVELLNFSKFLKCIRYQHRYSQKRKTFSTQERYCNYCNPVCLLSQANQTYAFVKKNNSLCSRYGLFLQANRWKESSNFVCRQLRKVFRQKLKHRRRIRVPHSKHQTQSRQQDYFWFSLFAEINKTNCFVGFIVLLWSRIFHIISTKNASKLSSVNNSGIGGL